MERAIKEQAKKEKGPQSWKLEVIDSQGTWRKSIKRTFVDRWLSFPAAMSKAMEVIGT